MTDIEHNVYTDICIVGGTRRVDPTDWCCHTVETERDEEGEREGEEKPKIPLRA